MSPKYTLDQFRTQSQKLPPVLQDALYNEDVAEKIYETGKSAGLTVDKIGILAEEIGSIILGISKPSDFIKNLSESLGIDQDKARDIAGKINHAVFLPLREALKSTHQFDLSEETIQKGESAIRKSSAAPTASTPSPVAPTIAPAVKKPELRIGREPIDDESGIKNYELRTIAPVVPPPPKPPTAPITIPKPPIAPESRIPIPEQVRYEASMNPVRSQMPKASADPQADRTSNGMKQESRAVKPTTTPPPIGVMPSWLTKPVQESSPIDLRAQYKPTMPPSSPKVPPINLRELGVRDKGLGDEVTKPQPPLSPKLAQETGITPKQQPSPAPKPIETSKLPEKKVPTSDTDTYREPIE